MTIKMKILLLDNYDSFTYNLLHVVKELVIYFNVKRKGYNVND